MVEQVGSIFVECEAGRLHAPSFADVILRRAHDWSVAAPGEEGLIQVLSCLPQSYPGHSLLMSGRLPKAEVRGCSDTFETAA